MPRPRIRSTDSECDDALAQVRDPPVLRQRPIRPEERRPHPCHLGVLLDPAQVDDAVEERRAESIKAGARSKDGRPVGRAGCVDQQIRKDLAEDDLGEREEGSADGRGSDELEDEGPHVARRAEDGGDDGFGSGSG